MCVLRGVTLTASPPHERNDWEYRITSHGIAQNKQNTDGDKEERELVDVKWTILFLFCIPTIELQHRDKKKRALNAKKGERRLPKDMNDTNDCSCIQKAKEFK